MRREQDRRELWVAAWLPTLPLDVFARAMADGARPFAVGDGGSRPRIAIANDAAARAGIERGQAVATALALVPGLALAVRDAAAEARALGDLATFATRFTPHAACTPPDAVLAEVAASLALFGGLARLLALLREGFAARGHRPRLGIAPTPLAALALARAGIVRPVLAHGELPALLAPLPLTLFDIPAEARERLAASGITRFGELAALPRDALARRCGPGIPALCDRALGHAPDVRPAHVPPPRFEARLALPVPVHDVEALGFAVNRLVHDLAAWLLARGLGAERLDLSLRHEHHLRKRIGTPATELVFALGSATRSVAHLTGALRERLARVTLPAPVEALVLVAAQASPLASRNLDWLPGHERDSAALPLADRLRARLGDEGLGAVALRDEHRPESAFLPCAPGDARLAPPRARASPRRAALRHGTQIPPPADALAAAARREAPSAPRPLWLLAEPLPLAARAVRTQWRVTDDPERIESGWWDDGDIRRDYFVAEAPGGGLAWIYRDHRRGTDDGEWFLHGWFA